MNLHVLTGRSGSGKSHRSIKLVIDSAAEGARIAIVSARPADAIAMVQRIAPDAKVSTRTRRFELANGARGQVLSIRQMEALKQARADAIALPDASEMPVRAFTLACGALRESGGMLAIAADPPRRSKGDWTVRLAEAMESGELSACIKAILEQSESA